MKLIDKNINQSLRDCIKFLEYPLKKSLVVSTYLSVINLFMKESNATRAGPVGINDIKNTNIFSNFNSKNKIAKINKILHKLK
jgi:hypothetical protein